MTDMIKDSDARLDFAVDWTAWLVAPDTIASVQWLPDPGITVDTPTLAGAKATVWISGGMARQRYGVTCRVTTTAGRVDDRTIHVRIMER